MNKPFDLKVLGEKLKSRGLDLAEDSLRMATEETLTWIKESVKATPTPYDDLALVAVASFESKIFEGIDKIDGKVG